MPHKHIVKTYIRDGYYHIYNRGVDKRKTYLDDQDYRVFLHLLKYYLSPLDQNSHPLANLPNYSLVRARPLANLENEVELLAYCLMPNHFHLLIKQLTTDGMTKLLRRLSTTYSMYFNKRYGRVGHLYQGNYKAALVPDDGYLLHLSRYIHLNPAELTRSHLVSYPYSSYPYYLGKKETRWLKPEIILSFFDKSKLLPFLKKYNSYKEFVEGSKDNPYEAVGNLAID